MSYRDLPTDLQSMLKDIIGRLDDLERRRTLPPNKRFGVDENGVPFIEDLITGEITPAGCPEDCSA